MFPKENFIKLFPFLFLALLIHAKAVAQSDSWNVGVEVSTALTKDFNFIPSFNVEQRVETLISYSAIFSKQVNERVAIEIGFKVLNKGNRFVGNRFSNFTPDAILDYHVKNKISFLSIPLNLKVASDNLNKGFYFRGGFQPAFYLRHQNLLVYQDQGVRHETLEYYRIDDVSDINLFVNLGVGYSFLIHNHFQLSFEPYIELMMFELFGYRSSDEENTLYHSVGISTRIMILD